jgi:hypothetical protein
MTSRWSSVSRIRKEDEVGDEPNVLEPSGLFACPDCKHSCSRLAESCPECGRFFQRINDDHLLRVDRRGWIWTIAGGIWWAFTLPWIVLAVLVFLFVVTWH